MMKGLQPVSILMGVMLSEWMALSITINTQIRMKWELYLISSTFGQLSGREVQYLSLSVMYGNAFLIIQS